MIAGGRDYSRIFGLLISRPKNTHAHLSPHTDLTHIEFPRTARRERLHLASDGDADVLPIDQLVVGRFDTDPAEFGMLGLNPGVPPVGFATA